MWIQSRQSLQFLFSLVFIAWIDTFDRQNCYRHKLLARCEKPLDLNLSIRRWKQEYSRERWLYYLDIKKVCVKCFESEKTLKLVFVCSCAAKNNFSTEKFLDQDWLISLFRSVMSKLWIKKTFTWSGQWPRVQPVLYLQSFTMTSFTTSHILVHVTLNGQWPQKGWACTHLQKKKRKTE